MKLDKKTVLKELKKREALKTPPVDFLDSCFDKQINFIKDTSSLKATLCTRRAAKSYTSGVYLLKEAFESPGATCLYIALTRESAKKIMWKDVLKVLVRKYKLKAKFNETNLTVTLSNGSIIYLVGVDSSEDEKEKLLGQKYKLVVIDEGASYNIDLRQLVYSTLKPAVADYRGTICIMGTPGNITTGLYFDITEGNEPGWSVHKWNTFDNPFMAKQWQEEIDEIELRRPLFKETPMFAQMYMGKWVTDESALVYKFHAERNIAHDIPLQAKGDWQYLLGVDLGYEDDSAFVVCAYHEHDKVLYIIDTYSRAKMDITDVATKIRELQATYNVQKVIIDGANKQAVEEIQRRHHIPLVTADKKGKEDFIEIMNAELIQGNIKIVLRPNTVSKLADEWRNLVWLERGGKIVVPRKENPSCKNHLSDACLYAWRYCYSYLSKPLPPPPPKWGSPEWHIAEVERMQDEAEEYFKNLEANIDPYSDY